MGLGKKAIEHVATAIKALDNPGEVLTLGELDIHFDEAYLREALIAAGFEVPDGWTAELSKKESFRSKGYLSQKSVFSAFGLNSVRSLDASAYEGCDLIHDLNEPDPPGELRERFALIVDGGTLEHIFHVPNALIAIGAMLRPGGVIVHQNPASNYLDHGFYSFSPTFYSDYYRGVGYELGADWLVAHLRDGSNQQAEVINYEPASNSLHGQLDTRMYANFFWARKTDEAKASCVPTQTFYARMWENIRRNEEARQRREENERLRSAREAVVSLPVSMPASLPVLLPRWHPRRIYRALRRRLGGKKP